MVTKVNILTIDTEKYCFFFQKASFFGGANPSMG